MPKKKPSRQRLWQQKKRENGLCVQCGGAKPCFPCLAKGAERQRKLKKFKPWKPGGLGRVPMWFRMGGNNQQAIR